MANNSNIFVISLKGSTQRRENLKAHFNAIGMPFEWIDAVYGKELSDEEYRKLCDLDAINKNPTWLNRSAIGCALSHYNAFNEIISRNLPYAIIFEDDVIIQKDFLRQVESIVPHLKKSEVVALFYQSWVPTALIKDSKDEVNHAHALYELADKRHVVSSAAYIITQEACKSMVKNLLPIRFTADSWGEFYKIGGFESLRCIYPRIVDVADAKSTIEYMDNNWKSRITKWIDNYKVFPFYQLLKRLRNRNRMKMMKVTFVSK